MGYYADLIKQKQEKKNFRDPLGLGLTFHELGTPDDYKAKFKKGDKVKLRYGSGFKGEGVIVEGPIKMRASLTPTYRIKLTDGKVVGRYEEELAKNSKEEKEEKQNFDMGYYADLIKEKKEKQNSIVKKGTFNKGTYTIDKTTGMFGKTVYIVHAHYEKGPSKDMTFGSDSFETLQDAQKYADRLNSKEEKDNASVQDRFRHKGCMITIIKKGENQYTFSVEQDGREEGSNKVYPSQDKAEAEAKREVEVNWNEKEKGYYAKLAEEKAERNNDKTVSLYGKNYSFGSDRQKNQQEFKKAQDDFNREYFKVKEEMDELQKELKSKRFKLDQQWNTFYSQVKGFLGL